MAKEDFVCAECGVVFQRYQSAVKNRGRAFCSRSCSTQGQRGAGNSNFRNGDHCVPSICQCGKEKDYRAEQCALCSRASYPIDNNEVLVSDEEIAQAVLDSNSFYESATRLGISRTTATRKIKDLGLDVSHFRPGRNRFTPIEEILRKDSPVSRTTARNRIKKEGLLQPYQCSNPKCGLGPEWCGHELSLQLDHINGDPKDHRLENLRWLCPNCHSQTSNFTGRKRKKRGPYKKRSRKEVRK